MASQVVFRSVLIGVDGGEVERKSLVGWAIGSKPLKSNTQGKIFERCHFDMRNGRIGRERKDLESWISNGATVRGATWQNRSTDTYEHWRTIRIAIGSV